MRVTFSSFRIPIVLLTVGFLASCNGDSPTETPETPETGLVDIALLDDSFSRTSVLVEAGTTVRWTNQAGIHTITPDGHSEWTTVNMTEAGQVFEHTFDEPGEYPFYCEPHLALGMSGVVRVE
jgi:plastocyanin